MPAFAHEIVREICEQPGPGVQEESRLLPGCLILSLDSKDANADGCKCGGSLFGDSIVGDQQVNVTRRADHRRADQTHLA